MGRIHQDLGRLRPWVARLRVLAAAIGLIAAGLAVAQQPGGEAPAPSAKQETPPSREGKGRAGPQGGPPSVHDPVMAKENDVYYLYATGRGVSIHSSKDMATWDRRGRAFERMPEWTSKTIPGSRDYYWAPDISFFDGKWHLYYSVSTFGKNRSAIGQATNDTLDPGRPDYRWEDRGHVIESTREDDFNAIDPNIAFDAEGRPWLSFGSFWSGIKLVAIDPSTGRPPEEKPQLYSLASRPRTGRDKGAIEAPFLVRRGEFYYLFASFDFCCRGVNSTYNIRVGRSPEITGPYVDRDGTPMLEGGGTLVRSGAGRWRGPGHNAVFRDGDTDWLVYHAYDAEANGISRLRIETLTWDDAGWPRPSLSADEPAANRPPIPEDLKIIARYYPGYNDWKPWRCTITADRRVAQEILDLENTQKKESRLSEDDLRDLLAKIKEADFFALKGRYDFEVTGCPTLKLTVTRGGKMQEVVVYAPDEQAKVKDVRRSLMVWSEVLRKVPSPNPEQKPELYQP